MTRRVGILVFSEVEVLDFCGPFEVFCDPGSMRAADERSPRPTKSCWWPSRPRWSSPRAV